MADSIEITIATKEELRPKMGRAWDLVCKGIEGGPVLVTLSRPENRRSNSQNSKLWPMLTDISQQLEWYGQKLSPDDWKDLLGHEWRSQRIVPGISGGYVALGAVRTSKMKKREFSELIEILYAFGSERGVQWSEKALESYQQYREAQ